MDQRISGYLCKDTSQKRFDVKLMSLSVHLTNHLPCWLGISTGSSMRLVFGVVKVQN